MIICFYSSSVLVHNSLQNYCLHRFLLQSMASYKLNRRVSPNVLSLIVLERTPECRMNVSSVVNVTGSMELRCDVNYAGGWTPYFDCVV